MWNRAAGYGCGITGVSRIREISSTLRLLIGQVACCPGKLYMTYHWKAFGVHGPEPSGGCQGDPSHAQYCQNKTGFNGNLASDQHVNYL
jgi:hypothetical protein